MWRLTGTKAMTLGALAVASAFAGTNAGCGGTDEQAEAEACMSTREFFTAQVYGRAMQSCLSCHTPGGMADQDGAKFMLYRETYPDFVSANIEAIRDYAKLEIEGKPVILRKPLGERKHGGGAVLKEDSEEYAILTRFVNTVRSGSDRTCDGDKQLGVDYLDGRETARKAALVLAGRYPTDEELGSASSTEGLHAFVEKLSREEAFYDRLREIWNDALLTERPLDAGVGGSLFNAPDLYDADYPGYTTEKRSYTSASVTQEPLRLIEYVVRNDLPFAEVVSASYVVANPYLARLYGLPHESPLVPESFLDWRRIDFSPVQNRQVDGKMETTARPVAGVLSTPAFLTRWETTPTNKGRKRARIVLKNFLATDIFKFAQRPVDSTALTSVQNPTANSPMCSVCHVVIDPIAGGFRGFGENNLVRFEADDEWHDDMLPPGFLDTQMPPSSYGSALMWLGAQIPRDPRFGIAVAQVMYEGIVGDAPLTFPDDEQAPDYEARVRAYNIQNDWFVRTGADFAAARFDLRRLVVAIVDSAYFRAKSGDANKDGLHAGLGQGRLLTPEMLGRKYRATTGLYFFRYEAAGKDENRARDGYLRSDLVTDRDWRLVYGGIDSGDVTKRTDAMSPIMLAASQYTASLVACRATTYDFTKPAAERRLFRGVELGTTPLTVRSKPEDAQAPVEGSEAKIRATIKDLYFRLLGETVAVDSEEVTKTYGLFLDVWKDHEQTNATSGGKNKGLSNGGCAAVDDWDEGVTFAPNQDGRLVPQFPKLAPRPDGAPYEPGMRLDRDDTFTIRSWQAVMTYLLTDYRFTHE